MSRKQRQYDTDHKVQSVKLAKEIGLSKAAKEIGVSPSTLNGWIKTSIEGKLYLAELNHLKMEAEDYTTPEGEKLKRIKLSLAYLDTYLEEWYDKNKELENE